MFIAAHEDIWVFVDLVMLVELFHFGERLVGGHDDLDVLEVFEVGKDRFCLVLAVFAIRAEIHDYGLAVLVEVVFGQVGGAIEFQEAKWGDGREAHVGGAGVGRIGGGLIWKSLSGYDVADS